MIYVAFEIPDAQGPALRAAIEEIRNTVGDRLTGNHRFEKESALTSASAALGTLGAAINALVPRPEEDFA